MAAGGGSARARARLPRPPEPIEPGGAGWGRAGHSGKRPRAPTSNGTWPRRYPARRSACAPRHGQAGRPRPRALGPRLVSRSAERPGVGETRRRRSGVGGDRKSPAPPSGAAPIYRGGSRPVGAPSSRLLRSCRHVLRRGTRGSCQPVPGAGRGARAQPPCAEALGPRPGRSRPFRREMARWGRVLLPSQELQQVPRVQ